MGRDRTRVLICAAASLVLIVAATLAMDWFRVAFDIGVDEVSRIAIAIDLRTLRTCTAVRVCTTAPLSPLPGMFPTLAVVTLWSSLGFAALVGFQAGIRLLTGNANDAVAKLGYMFALTTISIAVATAYLFGPEAEAKYGAPYLLAHRGDLHAALVGKLPEDARDGIAVGCQHLAALLLYPVLGFFFKINILDQAFARAEAARAGRCLACALLRRRALEGAFALRHGRIVSPRLIRRQTKGAASFSFANTRCTAGRASILCRKGPRCARLRAGRPKPRVQRHMRNA